MLKNLDNLKYKFSNNKVLVLDNNKEIGFCEFVEDNDTWNIIHTVVLDEYQGQGIAKKLVDYVILKAKENNKILTADCSYAKKVIDNLNK